MFSLMKYNLRTLRVPGFYFSENIPLHLLSISCENETLILAKSSQFLQVQKSIDSQKLADQSVSSWELGQLDRKLGISTV